MDAAYALLIEESIRVGIPLETSVDNVKQWAAGFGELEPPSEEVLAQRRARTEEERMVAQNNAALAELRKIMPGLGV